MSNNHEKRRALRIALNVPTVVEAISQPQVTLHANLESVYERVHANDERAGEKFPAIICDLSTNGAFIAGEALPLLSRVAFTFPLEGFGQVDVLGWTLWRRDRDCHVPRTDGSLAELPKGFGVLFEAIAIDARVAIHKAVTSVSG